MKIQLIQRWCLAGVALLVVLLGTTGCGEAGKVGEPEGAAQRTPPADGVLPPS